MKKYIAAVSALVLLAGCSSVKMHTTEEMYAYLNEQYGLEESSLSVVETISYSKDNKEAAAVVFTDRDSLEFIVFDEFDGERETPFDVCEYVLGDYYTQAVVAEVCGISFDSRQYLEGGISSPEKILMFSDTDEFETVLEEYSALNAMCVSKGLGVSDLSWYVHPAVSTSDGTEKMILVGNKYYNDDGTLNEEGLAEFTAEAEKLLSE